MDEETHRLLKEILLDKFSLDLSDSEAWIIAKYPLLLCHIIKGETIEFEFLFRETQLQYGSNLVDAAAKFASKDVEMTPEFTGRWKLA